MLSIKYKKAAALLIGVIILTTICGTMLTFCVKEPETEVYLIAPNATSLMECYIIKTKAGKLIVIDGGYVGREREKDPYIKAALRAVAGKKKGELVEVEAWFLSHAHNDHINELARVMREYVESDKIKINNFYFDFPPYNTPKFPYKDGDYEDYLALQKAFTNYANVRGIEVPEGTTYYDMLNGAYVNAGTISKGQDIIIDEVRFEMLQTWDLTDMSDVNSSSLVFRMHAGDKTVLFLHDLGMRGGNRLLKKYGDKLKSDYVHMAHHGQKGVSEEVYQAINADVHLWGTRLDVWTDTEKYNTANTRMWVNGGVDFDKADEHNIVTCLYEAYPSDPTSIEAWKKVLPLMRII